MTRQNKTILIAIWPDGQRHVVRKVGKMWRYGEGVFGFPLASVIHDSEKYYGVKFHREPNPSYREPDVLDRVARELHKILGPNTRRAK